MTLGDGGIADIDMRFATKDFAYDAPLDMRSLTDSEIRIAREDENFVVSGRVTIMEAGLTGDVNFDTGLLAAMTARRKLDLTEERDSFLERLRFNVNVNTATPILVDNNLARAEARARLRVVGTPYEPGLTGQMTLLQGGEVRLNERRYEVERGVITFVDERRIFPSFDLLLNTTAGNYDINIAVTGTPGDTETTLTSEPTLPEPDIMAMLVTGRTLDAMRGEEFEVAQEQALSYLAGRVGNTLGRGLQEATGLSEVRIEPTLIANEADPSARLTLGQELTDELKLVYSTESHQQQRSDLDGRVRRHPPVPDPRRPAERRQLSRGLPARRPLRRPGLAAAAAARAADGGVRWPWWPARPARRIPLVRDEFDVKAGHTYDFFAIREEVVGSRGGPDGARVHAVAHPPRAPGRGRQGQSDAARQARTASSRCGSRASRRRRRSRTRSARQWHRGVFDKQRADDGAEALREWLMTDGYLQPKVSYTIDDSSPERRRVTFQVGAGPHYDKVVLAFDGASGIDPDELDAIVNPAGARASALHRSDRRHRAARALLPRPGLSLRRDRRAAHRVSGLDRARRARGPGRPEVHRASRGGVGEQGVEHRGAAAAAAGDQRASRSCRAPPSKRSTRFGRCIGRSATTTSDRTTPWSSTGIGRSGRCHVHDRRRRAERRRRHPGPRQSAASTSSSCASSS